MKFTKNVGTVDRILRLLFAEVFFIGGFFWTHGTLQIVLFVVTAIMLVTALTKFCGLYTLVGIRTCPIDEAPASKKLLILSVITLVLVAILGTYGSMFFTKKFFLEDYSRMNHYYKQTLFFTGQNKRDEAMTNYAGLVSEYDTFYAKYSAYQPYAVSRDTQFTSDLQNVQGIITTLGESVKTGDLSTAHKDFEAIRPIFQDILKRNGFSMLAVYLVDFHDAMEKVLTAANAKDSAGIIALHEEVDGKLKAVEEAANDAEIQKIRANFDALYTLAQNGQAELLHAKAAELKSSFVAVYLKRG